MVNTVHARILADLENDFPMKTEPVKFNANGVQTILHAPHLYFNGLVTGVSWTTYELGVAAKACPHQQIILAGYSQGAMVMHRVLTTSATPRTAGRSWPAWSTPCSSVTATKCPTTTTCGTARPGADGLGHRYVAWSHTTGQTFSQSLGKRVLEVCNSDDPVCDSNWWDLDPLFILIHLRYTNSQPVLAAADYAAGNILDHCP